MMGAGNIFDGTAIVHGREGARLRTGVIAALLLAPTLVQAGAPWRQTIDAPLALPELRLSPYTVHYDGRSRLHRDVWLVGVNLPLEHNGSFAGAAYFSNSFGQPSAYVYMGRKYRRPFGIERTYWHWTAGILYGYRPPFENKVPLNRNGWSPGVVPSLGYQLSAESAVEVNMLGSAGLMFSYVMSLP